MPFDKQFVNYPDPADQENGRRHSLCGLVWKFLLFVGSVLTFIRNFIGNLIMLLIIGCIIIAYQAASSLREQAEAVFYGQSGLSAETATAKVLYLPLAGELSERPFAGSQFEQIYRRFNENLSGRQTHELDGIEKALAAALQDDNIQAVLLDLQGMGRVSMTAASRIADQVQALSKSGRQTIAVAGNFSQGAYIIAAAASQICLDPLGSVDLRGIALSSLYYSELLDKLHITPYIFRAGRLKSAVEPFTRDGMSAEVRAEYQQTADELWSTYERKLHQRRQLSRSVILPAAADYIRELERCQGDSARMALERGLVDELAGRMTVLDRLREEFGAAAYDPLLPNMIDYRDYLQLQQRPPLQDQRIAVVYATGTIVESAADPSLLSAQEICAVLHNLALDKHIKAVVLYLNSPGGSATASEQIRRSIVRLQERGIKVVVSIQGMGASGAYWLASAADRILATEESIVGSIGVFSVGLGFHRLLNEAGVYQDGVSTHEFANLPLAREMGENTRRYYELSVEHTYQTFINLVAAGRGLDPAAYESYAEGRIFTAPRALDLGLLDGLGNLHDAEMEAAQLLGGRLEDYSVVNAFLPQDDGLSMLESLLFNLSASVLPDSLSSLLQQARQLKAREETPLQEQIKLVTCLQQPLL